MISFFDLFWCPIRGTMISDCGFENADLRMRILDLRLRI